jgi:hypothetical protein
MADLPQAPLTADGLVMVIEAAFKQAFEQAKGGPPPGGGEDLKILFEGIANGLLFFLKAHEEDFIDSLSVDLMGERKTLGQVRADFGFQV